jgi:peptidoglycan hydrolase-like protein with peptidoglycan-binding domain
MTAANGVHEQDEVVELPHYRVIQKDVARNTSVTDFESLVTHHPADNSAARILDGVVIRGEEGRRHAVVGGEIQEIEVPTRGNTYVLKPDQVLIKKDFMLEDSRIASFGRGVRDVDLPSPVAGYIGARRDAEGLVDIYDREGGDVIARVRHMSDIRVNVGDTIEYGQALGTQSDVRTGAKHAHLEMDTRYYQQYENYIADLTSGRLSIDEARRTQGIQPLPIVDDGVVRLGESSGRVGDLQRVLAEENYRGRDGQPVAQDGVYRLSMQPAVLNFQRDHGIPQTGDIDAATLQLAPPLPRRELDRPDHNDLRNGPGMPDMPGRYGAPPHDHGARGGQAQLEQGAHALERLSPQERDVHDRAYAAVQVRGGYSEEESRNIAAAGVLAFKESRLVHEAQDVGVYGDRLRISSFPYGREREPNFNADVNLADAAQKPAQQSLQQIQTLDLQQAVARQQAIDPNQQQIASGPSIGARVT